jgi:glycosyltransferase involved in cell wall biosynthesis
MSGDVSVLIPTRNRARVLQSTLEAMCGVRRADVRAELVVVDNGSTDDTSNVCRAFRSKLPLTYLREPRAGKCHALNRALREARLGDIVVFTDDDVTPDEDWLESIVSTSSRWPKHSVFGGRIDPEWPSSVPLPRWVRNKQIQTVAFAAHSISDRECEYPAGREPFGPNYWVRRAALEGMSFLESVGPHPRRRTLGDETHFLRQLRRRGYAPVYSPAARVRHRIEAERMTKAAIYRRAFQYGRGFVHTEGVPESSLLETSEVAWRLRVVSNVAIGAMGIALASLEPDEDRRFAQLVARLFTLAKNVEALREKPLLQRGGARHS